MSRASHYRAQADLARRLAEITVQPNLERELRPVSNELDDLANEIGVGALLQKVPLGTEFGR
jgi:hypothetical protein